MPKVYGYTRVSTEEQRDGLVDQKNQIENYFNYLSSTQPDSGMEFTGIFVERGESAWHKPWNDRAVSGYINAILEPGDHVVIARLDRGFRKVADYATTTELWKDQGVTLHVLDYQIRTDTPMGEMIGNIAVAFAQMQSRYTSERVKESVAVRRADGVKTSAHPPTGFKHVLCRQGKHKGRHIVVPDRKKVLLLRYIRFLRDKAGVSAYSLKRTVDAALDRKPERHTRFKCFQLSWQQMCVYYLVAVAIWGNDVEGVSHPEGSQYQKYANKVKKHAVYQALLRPGQQKLYCEEEDDD